jgi:hypothetical protein
MSTNYEAPHCATFSILPLLHLQIFSSAPCSQTLLAYARLLMLKTKFHSHTKQLVELLISIFRCLGRFAKESVLVHGCVIRFVTSYSFYGGGLLAPPSNPQAGGPHPVGCSRLLIQYICSYPPYLEAVFSICNLRMRHAVVTEDQLTDIIYP